MAPAVMAVAGTRRHRDALRVASEEGSADRANQQAIVFPNGKPLRCVASLDELTAQRRMGLVSVGRERRTGVSLVARIEGRWCPSSRRGLRVAYGVPSMRAQHRLAATGISVGPCASRRKARGCPPALFRGSTAFRVAIEVLEGRAERSPAAAVLVGVTALGLGEYTHAGWRVDAGSETRAAARSAWTARCWCVCLCASSRPGIRALRRLWCGRRSGSPQSTFLAGLHCAEDRGAYWRSARGAWCWRRDPGAGLIVVSGGC